MSNGVSKYVWDAYEGIDTRELEAELGKDTPKWPKAVKRSDFPLKNESLVEDIFKAPRYEAMYEDVPNLAGDYPKTKVTAIPWESGSINEAIEASNSKMDWYRMFYPEEAAQYYSRKSLKNKRMEAETRTDEDREWKKKAEEERKIWETKFKNIPSSSEVKPAVTYELDQPDFKEIVGILDTIGPTLDSLITDMYQGHGEKEVPDSLYSNIIKNKLLEGDIYMRGIDPFNVYNLQGGTSLISGLYEDIEDAADTLNFQLTPNTKQSLNTFTHELLHGSGARHKDEGSGQASWAVNTNYALRELYKKNPEGYKKLEDMVNQWKEGDKVPDWIVPEDLTHSEYDFAKEEADFIKGKQIAAHTEFKRNLEYLRRSDADYDSISKVLKTERDEKLIKAELEGRNLQKKYENSIETNKLIKSWFE
jgi:hypothetical protein